MHSVILKVKKELLRSPPACKNNNTLALQMSQTENKSPEVELTDGSKLSSSAVTN